MNVKIYQQQNIPSSINSAVSLVGRDVASLDVWDEHLFDGVFSVLFFAGDDDNTVPQSDMIQSLNSAAFSFNSCIFFL